MTPPISLVLAIVVLTGCATLDATSRGHDTAPPGTARPAITHTAIPAAAMLEDPVDAWPPPPDPFMEALADAPTDDLDEQMDTHLGQLDRILRGLEALVRQGGSMQQSLLRLRVKPPSTDAESAGDEEESPAEAGL